MSSAAVERKTHSTRSRDLTFGITFGAAGVVAGIAPTDNDGFDGTTPITSSGAGVYVMKFTKSWQRMLQGDGNIKQAAAYSAAAAIRATNFVDGSATSPYQLTFTIVNSAGAATQPAIGDKLYLTLQMKQ